MPLTVIALKNAGDGKHSDGNGLFIIKKGDAGKWVYRYSFAGRRREMGLGTWPTVGLGDARRARDKWAAVKSGGKDPISERERQIAEERAALDATDPTFAEAVDIVFEAKKAGLRGGGERGRWRSPLDSHVIPKLGKRRLSSITPQDVKAVISPIWRTKHPTAQKAVQRSRIVFREMKLMGFDCDPFTIDAAVRMLGEHRHVVQHIPATPWQDIPALWQRLDPSLASARCLRWLVLTLVRVDAGRGARVSEMQDDVWTVPADRIKGHEGYVSDFRVPLSAPAVEIVEQAHMLGREIIFPGHRGQPISDAALEKHLTEIGEPGRPHGFRSSFRTWVQDTDACAWEVAETALGHKIGGTVERSYARSDLLERRRLVMDAWAGFVTGAESADVVRIGGRD